jgi:hypothetical protein
MGAAMPAWLIAISWGAIVLGLATTAAIVFDMIVHPQRMKIMNTVWPVTELYFPVAGWWLYTSMGRPMAIDAPEMTREQPHWKSIFLSATHCGSGCVIGDILGAPIVFATGWTIFGEPLFSDYFAEFALAYVFGIAFQYFPIRAMRQVGAREALIDAVKADTLSLVAFTASGP